MVAVAVAGLGVLLVLAVVAVAVVVVAAVLLLLLLLVVVVAAVVVSVLWLPVVILLVVVLLLLLSLAQLQCSHPRRPSWPLAGCRRCTALVGVCNRRRCRRRVHQLLPRRFGQG